MFARMNRVIDEGDFTQFRSEAEEQRIVLVLPAFCLGATDGLDRSPKMTHWYLPKTTLS